MLTKDLADKGEAVKIDFAVAKLAEDKDKMQAQQEIFKQSYL